MEENYRALNIQIDKSAELLLEYCEQEQFKGWDPYDGLNSRVFKSLGLNRVPFFRLAWIQLFKRNPFNLRRLLLVPKGYNPKGIGLFLSGYSKLLLAVDKANSQEVEKLKSKVHSLAKLLISLQSQGYSGACWGYDFDWEARNAKIPAYQPTVVATGIITNALFVAYQNTGHKEAASLIESAANFIVNDLKRTYKDDKRIYEYTYVR